MDEMEKAVRIICYIFRLPLNFKMTLLFLAGVVFIFVAFLKLIFSKTMFPHPKAQSKNMVDNFLEDSTFHETLIPVKKQMKHRILCKSRGGAIFKPKFKNKESAPNLVYMAYTPESSTVVFFSDRYDTVESKAHHVASRLFDINLPGQKEKYMSPPLYCNGLFVLPTVNNVLVCNPETKEVITLPQSSKHVPRPELIENVGLNMRVGFGFLRSTQAYKVANFFYRSYNLEEQRYSMGFEVFTIGVSSCWRVLAEDPPYPIRNSCSTFTGKSIYFYIWHDLLDPYAPNAFLCFNLKSEKFSLLYPPYSLKHVYIVNMRLSNLRGSLCLSVLSTNNTKLGVFTSKHGTGLDWTPIFCFNVVLQDEHVLVRPIVEYAGKLLIHFIDLDKQRLEFHDHENEAVDEVNGELEDAKMKEEGFRLFLDKPWFYVSCYEECLFKFQS